MNMQSSTHVLLVEDNATDAFLLESLLSDIPDVEFDVEHVSALSEAQKACRNNPPDIILLDLSLPDGQGLETIEQLRAVATESPILALTGSNDLETTDSAVKAGAQDLLRKGEYNAEFLGKTIRYAMESKNGESELKHLAHFDPLTGIANRVLFIDNLTHALASAERHKEKMSVMFIDLDDYKKINDKIGDKSGDKLLVKVAKRLSEVVGDDDTLARLGGDEFAIILRDTGTIYNVDVVAKNIIESLSTSFNVDEQEINVSASIGIAIYPEAGDSTNSLLKNADIAMYHAKNHGKNKFHIFTESIDDQGLEKIKMERDLHHALARNEFELHYQPLYDMNTREINGVEALLRWRYEAREKLISPGEFLPLLEKTGLIVEVGEWALRTACKQCKDWHNQGMFNFRVAVNVSPRQFQQDEPVEWIANALKETALEGKYLNVEITEDILLSKNDDVNSILKQIRKMGVSISIDDFGTGYSSLRYLMDYEFDIIKIDRCFLNTLFNNPATPVIFKAIIQMAHGLGLKVVAEGVEETKQYDYLEKEGCDMLQGYLFSHPLEAQDLYSYIEDSYSRLPKSDTETV